MFYFLRPARLADKAHLDQLRRLAYKELFHATWGMWDEDRHQRHFEECWKQGNIQIIEIDRNSVGMLQLQESHSYLEVSEIQIDPEHQGQGIGTNILKDVIGIAHKRDQDVKLATGLKNLRAAQLYLKLGFVQTDSSDTHIYFTYLNRHNGNPTK